MDMGTCKDCGKTIHRGHGQQRCESCQLLNKKMYQKEYNNKYYKKAGAIKHDLYQYCKFLKTLTTDELMALVSSTKNDLKYTTLHSQEWYLLRSKIKALTTEYSSREEDYKEKSKADSDDKEREEIIKRGGTEYE